MPLPPDRLLHAYRQMKTIREFEERLHVDSLTLDLVKQWRVVHFPITIAFTGLALTHIVAICFFWGWR